MDNTNSITVKADPVDLTVGEANITGSVFVIPSDAPIPNELAEAAASGDLLTRLKPLTASEVPFFLVSPISGSELTSLAPAWRAIATAKKVFALFDLPGARYDVLFTQAVKQIGLRRLEWPEVSEGLARRAALRQSIGDATPWALASPSASPQKSRHDPFAKNDSSTLPIPESSDDATQ